MIRIFESAFDFELVNELVNLRYEISSSLLKNFLEVVLVLEVKKIVSIPYKLIWFSRPVLGRGLYIVTI